MRARNRPSLPAWSHQGTERSRRRAQNADGEQPGAEGVVPTCHCHEQCTAYDERCGHDGAGEPLEAAARAGGDHLDCRRAYAPELAVRKATQHATNVGGRVMQQAFDVAPERTALVQHASS